jgi:tRNA dimethylallyltransferase
MSGVASTLLFWVYSESETLKKRLDSRVDKMLEAGLLEEVKSMNKFLHDKERAGISVDRSQGIWVSIGWKEFEPYLTALASDTESQETLNNVLSLSIEQTKIATRQYAKRQTRWIRLKLIPALSGHNALHNLYLLDGTNLTRWTPAVLDPAIDLTGKFLAGENLCAPSDLSNVAKEYLALEKPIEFTDGIRHECEMCHTITVTEEQWQAHLKSRTHRRFLKKGQKLAHRGRSSLPESAHNPAPPDTF